MCKITESPPSSSVTSPCGAAKELVVVMDHRRLGLPYDHAPQQQQQQPQPPECSSSNRKRVRFGANTEHVFEKTFTQEDMCNIWYTVDEFQAIKSEIYAMMRFAATRSKKTLLQDSHGWHWRGWEHVREKRPRKVIRKRHSEDVLYFHRVLKVRDSDGIAIYAENISRESSERARELAITDEAEAFEIYNDTLHDTLKAIALNIETICSKMNQSADDDDVTAEDDKQEEPTEEQECSELQVSNQAPEEVEPCLTICREDGISPIHLLEKDTRQAALLPHFDEDDASFLSLFLISPYDIASMLLPCVC